MKGIKSNSNPVHVLLHFNTSTVLNYWPSSQTRGARPVHLPGLDKGVVPSLLHDEVAAPEHLLLLRHLVHRDGAVLGVLDRTPALVHQWGEEGGDTRPARTWTRSCRNECSRRRRGRQAPTPCTLFKICHSMLSTKWQDRTSCMSLVDTFFQKLSSPLIGWHSCQLSACSPSAQASTLEMLCSYTNHTIVKTKFPSHFVQKIKSVSGQCKVMSESVYQTFF